MKATLMGKRALDFTTADNKAIKGTSIYIAFPAEGVDGMICEKHFIRDGKVDEKMLVVGADIDLVFNSRGKIDAVLKVQ